MRHLFTRILIAITLPCTTSVHAEQPTSIDTDAARRVILIIGDGMDDQQITIARNYLAGARGRLLLDELPLRSTAQILTVADSTQGKAVYVADSANTATALASGEVTSRGRIATAAGTDAFIPTIVEQAQQAGLRTGIVTTASVTDATPAAFASHINLRYCENPAQVEMATYRDIELGSCAQFMKSRGGPGSIADQLANSKLDVLLGGGSKHFSTNTPEHPRTAEAMAKDNGFQVIYRAQQLKQLPAEKPLLGLFSPYTMPVRLRAEDDREAEPPSPSLLNYVHRYLGDVELPAPMQCVANPAAETVPSLREMTAVALTRLHANNRRGFFLMVESASIDKQTHERKPCGALGEVEQLEEALQLALDFANTHGNTLILVTADHSQAAQIIPDVSLFKDYPIPTYTPGLLARVITPEGSIMAINYATTNFAAEEHTGANVPLFANSEGLGRVPPFVAQPDIYHIMAAYLGLKEKQ